MDLNEFSSIIHDDKRNEADKIVAFNEFYNYYSALVEVVLKNETFSDRQLCDDIFRKDWNDKQSETVFKKCLYSSFKTLERVRIGIETNVVNKFKIGEEKKGINNFTDFLFIFSFDVFEIVRYAEEKYNDKKLNYDMGGRGDLTVSEIFENANIFLHIKHFGASSIHYRDFFPYTIFAIRLMIEVAGKRILGFNSITNDKGSRAKEIGTQIAWEFIKKDQLSNKRIQLPVEIDTVLKIEKWTNSYIHTGFIQPIYLVENALFFLEKLVFPCNQIKNYRGQALFAGTTKIQNYNTVKTDFENFVQSKGKGTKKYIINWKHEKQVDSTIISL